MTPMEAEARRKYPKSVVTPEEQAAIEAAIEAGKVRRIPRGVSAMADQLVWSDEKNGLVYRDKAVGQSVLRQGKPRKSTAPKRLHGVQAANAAKIEERERLSDIAVRMHIEERRTIEEIATALGRHKDTIKQYIKARGHAVTDARAIQCARDAAEARALHAEGLLVKDVAARLGLDRKTVGRYVRQTEEAQ